MGIILNKAREVGTLLSGNAKILLKLCGIVYGRLAIASKPARYRALSDFKFFRYLRLSNFFLFGKIKLLVGGINGTYRCYKLC